MDNLSDLFKIIELTRSQPQTGYTLAGIKKNELSNLAEHHYLVAFIAWQLASVIKSEGINIDLAKVLEFALMHDLGELFGGDIAMPYAKANPKARELAKAFEAENQSFLSKFFGSRKDYFNALSKEIMDAKSDEALIAKVADYVECVHYKIYIGAFSKFDADLTKPKLDQLISRVSEPAAKLLLGQFADKWVEELQSKDLPQILYGE